MSASSAIAFFSALGVICALALMSTLWTQPLFPLQTSNLAWTNAWLKMTVLDYYGAALPLCGIAIASARDSYSGYLWAAGFCLGGSPFCCAYVALRLIAHENGLMLRY